MSRRKFDMAMDFLEDYAEKNAETMQGQDIQELVNCIIDYVEYLEEKVKKLDEPVIPSNGRLAGWN